MVTKIVKNTEKKYQGVKQNKTKTIKNIKMSKCKVILTSDQKYAIFDLKTRKNILLKVSFLKKKKKN